ncbi:MAG: hypothetical protein RRZ71_07005 [Clostridia bacterium]
MKSKLLAFSLALIMIFALIPATAFAAGTVSVDDKCVFANGNAIEVVAQGSNTNILIGGVAQDLSPIAGDTANGYDLSGYEIFGGGDGRSAAVTFASTSITMSGGNVKSLIGGNFGKGNATAADCSKVTGDVRIKVTGGEVEDIFGGGYCNTSVGGTVYIDVKGATMDAGRSYIEGGCKGNGTEGSIDTTTQEITTNAVVNNVVMNIDGVSAMCVVAGGGGYTKVNTAKVKITNSTIGYLYAGGINGSVGDSAITLGSGAVIGGLAATKRGYLGKGKIVVGKGATVTNLYTGATTGCFSSDDDKASAVTGSMSIVVNGTVTNAYITPSINVVDGNVGATIPTLSVTGNTPIVMNVVGIDTGGKLGEITQFNVGGNASFSGNVEIVMPAADAATLTGKPLMLSDGAKLTNSTAQPVTVIVNGKEKPVQPGANITAAPKDDGGSEPLVPVVLIPATGSVSLWGAAAIICGIIVMAYAIKRKRA